MFTILYPNVGSVLAYVGAVAGFLIIYTIPVLVHLSKMREKLIHQKVHEDHLDFEGAIFEYT